MTKNKSRHQKSFKIIGQNIRSIRISKNISQEELAFKISSARNYIGCIERGEKFPSVSMLFDITSALNCKMDDLFKNI